MGDAQDKYREALEKAGGLVREGKEGTKEFTDATEDLVKAKGDLNFREKEFAESADISITALRLIAEEIGLTEDQTRKLIDANITLNNTTLVGFSRDTGTIRRFAHGGVVPGPVGAPVPAILHGGEVVLNQRQQAAVVNGAGGCGATVNIFVEGSVLSESDLVVAVRDGLVELERVNGSTGL